MFKCLLQTTSNHLAHTLQNPDPVHRQHSRVGRGRGRGRAQWLGPLLTPSFPPTDQHVPAIPRPICPVPPGRGEGLHP